MKHELYIGLQKANGNKVEYSYLIHILDSLFDGYTVATGRGMWKGQAEDTVIVTIIRQAHEPPVTEEDVSRIAKLLSQQEIWMVTTPCDITIIKPFEAQTFI